MQIPTESLDCGRGFVRECAVLLYLLGKAGISSEKCFTGFFGILPDICPKCFTNVLPLSQNVLPIDEN